MPMHKGHQPAQLLLRIRRQPEMFLASPQSVTGQEHLPYRTLSRAACEARSARRFSNQSALTSMRFGTAVSVFGTVTFNTPCLYSALTLS